MWQLYVVGTNVREAEKYSVEMGRMLRGTRIWRSWLWTLGNAALSSLIAHFKSVDVSLLVSVDGVIVRQAYKRVKENT